MTDEELIQHANALHGNLTSGDRDVRNMPSKEQEWWIGGARAVLESASVERLRAELESCRSVNGALNSKLEGEKELSARLRLDADGWRQVAELLGKENAELKKDRDEQKARADAWDDEFADIENAMHESGFEAECGPAWCILTMASRLAAEKAQADRAEAREAVMRHAGKMRDDRIAELEQENTGLEKDRDEQKARADEVACILARYNLATISELAEYPSELTRKRDETQVRAEVAERVAREQKARADRAAADAVQWMGKHAYADARCAALEKVVRSAANLLDGTDAVTLYPTGFVACAFNELRSALDSAQPDPDRKFCGISFEEFPDPATKARADRAVEAWKEANGYDDLLSAYSAAGDRIAALEKVALGAVDASNDVELRAETDGQRSRNREFREAVNALRAALDSAQPAPDAGITRDGIAAAENTARLFEPAPDAGKCAQPSEHHESCNCENQPAPDARDERTFAGLTHAEREQLKQDYERLQAELSLRSERIRAFQAAARTVPEDTVRLSERLDAANERIRELEHLIDLQRRKIGALEGELDAAKSDARFGHDLAKGRAERIRVACAELDHVATYLNGNYGFGHSAERLSRIARELEGKDSPGEHPEKEQENGRDGTDDTGPRIPQPLVREEAGAECDDTDLSGDGRGADAAGAPSETGDAAGERGDGARRTRAPGGGGVHGQQVDSDSGQPASMSEQSRSESTRAGCSSPPTGGLLDSSVIRDLVTLALDMPNSIRFARSDEAYAAAQRLLARYPR